MTTKARANKEYNQYKLIRVRHPSGVRDTTISLQLDVYCLAILAFGDDKKVDKYIQDVAESLTGSENVDNFSGIVSEKIQNRIEEIRQERRARQLQKSVPEPFSIV